MDRVVGGFRRTLQALALPVLVLAAGTAPASAQTSPPRYSIVELAGIPQRLNNNGEIAGWVYVGPDAHAAIYSNGTWRDLGVPPGDQLSALFGINNAGAAVGFSFAALPGAPLPDNRWQAIWAPAGASAVQPLSVLVPDSFNYAINDSDSIVGCLNRYDDVYPDPHRAFLYSNGSVTDLHAMLAPPATQTPFDFTCARDINNTGVVVGEVELLGRPRRGFVYRNGLVSRIEQGTSYLVNAKAISSSDKVVGEGRQSGFTGDHALVYDVSAGTITSLGVESTGAYNSRPNDVNTAGDVVGMMFLAVGEHAFLASGGQVFDLNDLIPAGSEWVLQEAVSINDARQIVGKGYMRSFPTVPRYFLLQRLAAGPAIANLIAQVRALQAQSFLGKGDATALVAMLNAADRHLRSTSERGAAHSLELFVRHLDIVMRTGRLSPTEGQPLIDEANRIIGVLTS